MPAILLGSRTRIARRIVGLFVACALVPVTALAILTYRRVANALEEQAHARLGDEAKASGLILVDRVGQLAGELESIAAAVARQPRGAGPVDALTNPRFQGFALQRADGSAETLAGETGRLPALDPRQQAQVAQGRTTLVAVPGSATRGGRLYLVHGLPGRAVLWGLADDDLVWGRTADRAPAPPGMGFCLLTATGRPLSCPEPPDTGLVGGGATPNVGTFRWQHDGTTLLAGYRQLFLGYAYAAPPWIIVLTLPESAVLSPLATFRRSFALVVVLALAVVFALGNIQIRRTMTPLEQLTSATQRVAAGDFSRTAVVASGDEFGVLADSFNRMAGDLERQFTTLAKLHDIDRAALAAPNADPISAAVLAAAPAILGSDRITLAVAETEDPAWWSITARNGDGGEARRVRVKPTPQEVAALRATSGGLRIPAWQTAPSYLDDGCGDGADERVVLPLLTNRGVRGALAFEHTGELTSAALGRARQLADQTALALSNAGHVDDLEQLSWGALTALARAIDAVSPWTAGHSERVTRAALEIGRRLELGAEDLQLLHRGGLLHDIGKIGVPAALLDKPSSLTPEEMRVVRSHPTVGARILAPIRAFRDAIPLVLHHHELLDGSGYPDGLRGDEIPLLVRILTVADIYDALVSNRPYRSSWAPEKALALLEDGAGTRFDPRATGALAAALAAGWTSDQQVEQPAPARRSLSAAMESTQP
jgi:putative nucleotidyltransferase with HDIG domain